MVLGPIMNAVYVSGHVCHLNPGHYFRCFLSHGSRLRNDPDWNFGAILWNCKLPENLVTYFPNDMEDIFRYSGEKIREIRPKFFQASFVYRTKFSFRSEFIIQLLASRDKTQKKNVTEYILVPDRKLGMKF